MTYSQNNEEQIIKEYFNGFKGTFLDIGANDGITFSNTYALLQRGWKGTLVECSPKVFEVLQKNMEPYEHRVSLLKVALGPFDKEDQPFYESGTLLKQGDTSLVSSLSIQETERWDSMNIAFEKITVPMMRFSNMLKRSMHQRFDFISIDIEGLERFVVPQIDFQLLKTSMVIIEYNGKDQKFFTDYMGMFDFRLIHRNAENLIFQLGSSYS